MNPALLSSAMVGIFLVVVLAGACTYADIPYTVTGAVCLLALLIFLLYGAIAKSIKPANASVPSPTTDGEFSDVVPERRRNRRSSEFDPNQVPYLPELGDPSYCGRLTYHVTDRLAKSSGRGSQVD